MTLLLLAASAIAATGWELHAQAGIGDDPTPLSRDLGVGGGPILWINPHVSLELLAQIGLSPYHSPHGDLRQELRLSLTPPDRYAPAMSAFANAGARFEPAPTPHGSLGLGVDLPVAERAAIRAQGGLLVTREGADSVVIQIGYMRTPPIAKPPPPPPPPPPPALPEVLVWIPHPVCQWVNAEELERLRPELPQELVLRVEPAEGQPVEIAARSAIPELQPRATQGGLVVAGRPGDVLGVGGHPLSAGDDGVVVMTANAGVVDVSVVGGGQSQDFRAAVAANHVVWVRPPAPDTLTVRFDQGSAELDAADKAQLDALLSSAGDWSFDVQGSWSPEDDFERNRALANSRAESAAAYLRSQGLSADRIRVLEAAPPESSPDPSLLRTCTVRPVPREASR